MAKKNNRSENGNDVFENVDPFAAKMENVEESFNFPLILNEAENRAGDMDKKRSAILERIKTNEGHIRRINNLIDQLRFKLSAESGGVWISTSIRPLVSQLSLVFNNAEVEMVPLSQNTAVVITVCAKGLSPLKKARGEEVKSVTLLPAENNLDILVRDYSNFTNEFPKNSLADIQGRNYGSVPLDRNNILNEVISWLK